MSSLVTKTLIMQAAVDVVCSQMGYDFGSLGSSPCGRYGGNDLCGEPGSLVAMADVSCKGGELDILECSYSSPQASCLGHEKDAIVFCGMNSDTGFEEGATRLVSAEGAPSLNGIGRLEVFHDAAWGTVCKSGFTSGAASVACKSMGYNSARVSGALSSCRNISGLNYCGDIAPSISEVSCSGQEANILECARESGDDVFCAAEESAVIHCSGDGQSQGFLR